MDGKAICISFPTYLNFLLFIFATFSIPLNVFKCSAVFKIGLRFRSSINRIVFKYTTNTNTRQPIFGILKILFVCVCVCAHLYPFVLMSSGMWREIWHKVHTYNTRRLLVVWVSLCVIVQYVLFIKLLFVTGNVIQEVDRGNNVTYITAQSIYWKSIMQ